MPTQSEAELMDLANAMDGKTSVDASSLVRMARDARDGLLDATPIQPPNLDKFAVPGRKGAVTMLYGPSGSSKSYFVTQNLISWHANGIRCACRFLEDTSNDYLGRILAQVSGVPKASDPGYMGNHFEMWSELFSKNQVLLDSIAPTIEADDSGEVSVDNILEWAFERVNQGVEMLVVDPFTAASGRDKPWVTDGKFVRRFKGIVSGKAHGLIVSHTTKDGEGMAGGADMLRFVTSAFEIIPNHDRKEYWCKVRVGNDLQDEKHIPDRIIRIVKGRFGEGTGYRLAMKFDPNFLTFNDIGLIIPKKREG